MSKKKKALILTIGCIVSLVLFILFNKYYNDYPKNSTIEMTIKGQTDEQYTVYYDINGDKNWSEDNSDKASYKTKSIGKYKKISLSFPVDAKNIRIDFGSKKQDIEIKDVSINTGKKILITKDEYNSLNIEEHQVEVDMNGDAVIINAEEGDPYLVVSNISGLVQKSIGRPKYINYVLVLMSLVLGFITSICLQELRQSIEFVKKAISNKKLIGNLAKNDFKQKYVSSYLGVIWGFIQPLITIAVYWFVFQVGFRQADVGNLPFIVWFVSGIIPWFFFSEALSAGTNVFMEYSYLVKKVVFKIETLPVIKIISTLFVHLFFIIFLVGVSAAYGYYPDWQMFQVFYYLFAMIVLVFSITVFTSAVVLFFRDLGQIITIIINVGFWATPIGWNITMLPEWLQKVFKLNPVFYIVTGYRDAFVEKICFWQRPYHTLYFWCFCLIMLMIGVKTFNKLRPHFSDVI